MGASAIFPGIDVGVGLGLMLAGILVQWQGAAGLYRVLAGFVPVLIPVHWFVQGRRLRRPAAPRRSSRPPAPAQESS